MPIYDMYPYTNLHELNLDWIIKVAKETQDALTDINTLVSDLSDLSDCLHAYPNFSPNPRLVCDYDFLVSGDIRASGHTVYTKNVVATGNISCDNMTASGDLTVSGTINGDLNGTAAKAGMARVLADSSWNAYNNIGATNKPIYWNLGAPTACGNSLDVSITGNAATATSAISASSATTAQNAEQLKLAKNFTLTGAVSGTVSSDLSTDLSIATTQNIIKKVSMQSSSWSTQATTPLAGATVTATAAITNIDWIPGTFNPDSVVFLGAIVTSYEEQSLTFYPVGLYYQSDFQEMVMTVGVDGMFAITDMDDAIFDVYYINKLT